MKGLAGGIWAKHVLTWGGVAWCGPSCGPVVWPGVATPGGGVLEGPRRAGIYGACAGLPQASPAIRPAVAKGRPASVWGGEPHRVFRRLD